MNTLIRPALTLFVLLSLLTGLAYPLGVTGLAQLLFPAQAAGSLVSQGGVVRGSALIGQAFSSPQYFWGRPSATGPMPYNANASSGSNLAFSNPAFMDTVKGRVEALRAADPGNTAVIPSDLVLASASGLDPHISPAAAAYQLGRVAKARKVDAARVQALVEANTERRDWGIFGEERVNVLKLNLALDAATDSSPK